MVSDRSRRGATTDRVSHIKIETETEVCQIERVGQAELDFSPVEPVLVEEIPDFDLPLETPVGIVGLQWDSTGALTRIRWMNTGLNEKSLIKKTVPIPPIPQGICSFIGKLHAYFESGTPLGDIPWNLINTQGWTPFQRRVYSSITAIPHGETRSYGWVASKLQTPFACRAVGQALKRNPLMILIPCHRVIPTMGGLGGFMGQADPGQPELLVKQRLIQLEDSYLSPTFSFLGAPKALFGELGA